MSSVIDLQVGYALAADLVVFRRNRTTVQIGTEAPRRILIADAPEQTEEVLSHLRETPTIADAIARLGGNGIDWQRVFTSLLQVGLLEPSISAEKYPPRLAGERGALMHRFGPVTTAQILTARADAVVLVEGVGIVADTVSDLLDAAGVGRIHQIRGSADRSRNAAGSQIAPPDTAAHHSPRVRYRRPATHVKPTLTVLTDGPSPGRLAALTVSVTPHLPIRITTARATVGPLVLPGVSTCLNCVARHRSDADPDWATVSAAAAGAPLDPAPLLAHGAAALAVAQTLDFIDGLLRPASIGATLDLAPGTMRPQRRVWPPHESCRCRSLAALPR